MNSEVSVQLYIIVVRAVITWMLQDTWTRTMRLGSRFDDGVGWMER